MYWWVTFVNIFLRIFVSVHEGYYWAIVFVVVVCFLVMSLSGSVIK